MDAKIILEILPQQKQANIFHHQWDSNPQPLSSWTNTIASLVKWLSASLRNKWLWVRIPLLSLKLLIWCLLRARRSMKLRQTIEGRFTLKLGRHTMITYSHIPSGLLMSVISSFRSIENEHDICRGKDCMKKCCEFLKGHAMKIINFSKIKMKLLAKEHQESYENAKICYIC